MIKKWLYEPGANLLKSLSFPMDAESPHLHKVLRRNMIIIMSLVTLVPLFMMALINHYSYQTALKREIIMPLKTLVNKTKHSFELFTAERLSAVNFIASAYDFEQLADQAELYRIFHVMRQVFRGFVDLGLIDASGLQVSYVGPYELSGKIYKNHDWFKEVMVRGEHVSDVFMGYRKFPHMVIAVKHESRDGSRWVLRATIDTDLFNKLITSMGLDPTSDAFVVSQSGVLQTSSRFYGKVLDPFPMKMPIVSRGATVLETVDPENEEILLAYAYFDSPSFVLMLVKPRSEVLHNWYTLKIEILLIFVASVIVIFLVVFKITDLLVKRIEESDRRRLIGYREMEHTNKLASIGRLAAGIAHEINNPMAIINEKAGLMEDFLVMMPNFEKKDRFLQLTASMKESVDRCRNITHRLLGFARRMDTEIEAVDLEGVIREVYGFLEKEAFHRNIDVQLKLTDGLPDVLADHGQLQQVFLNVLNNAFSAVDDGGAIAITTWDHDKDFVAASIQDNGSGMSEETRRRIFDPFFSTRRQGDGTGLGLSITYGIIQKLGGRIEVQSEEGEGTTFIFYLPKKAGKELEA
ncbi:MAG: two-component sensor histidine kinase [Deltaproteobacteria bacterium]|nr:two-component sensor histidine kinase [Deltaproteobacteria bacterium]